MKYIIKLILSLVVVLFVSALVIWVGMDTIPWCKQITQTMTKITGYTLTFMDYLKSVAAFMLYGLLFYLMKLVFGMILED